MCPGAPARCNGKRGDDDDGSMGRSRGGLTTKIHALVDAEGRPMKVERTPGQSHDSQPALDMLEDMQKGAILLADKAFDNDAIRNGVEDGNGRANIPTKSNRRNSFVFCKWLPYRNLVEHFFQ